jgi:hypothetical protein
MRLQLSRACSQALRSVLLCAGIALGSCAGGGGGGSSISFSFASATGTATEGGAAMAITVVLHTSLAALSNSVSVDVIDNGGGSATSGVDYAAFAPVTVTFPIGSIAASTPRVPGRSFQV